jgi:hypothetical protein
VQIDILDQKAAKGAQLYSEIKRPGKLEIIPGSQNIQKLRGTQRNLYHKSFNNLVIYGSCLIGIKSGY